MVILDLETEWNAVDAIEQIRRSCPTGKIVLLSGIEDQNRARDAFDHGADGIILTMQPPAIVCAVIESLYPSPKLQARGTRDGLVGAGSGPLYKQTVDAETQSAAWPDTLTGREHEVIQLVRQGLSNKDIACTLSIRDSTVRHHMTNIFDKVGVPNRQKLLVYAIGSAPLPPGG